MNKLLLSLALAISFGTVQAQNLFNYGFEGTTATMVASGWQLTNQSTPIYVGAPKWTIPTTAPTTTFSGGAQSGTAASFATADFYSTGTASGVGSGTISNWLISPNIMVQNGDVVSFYTRLGSDNAVIQYADNLELRMSTQGAATINPSAGASDLGSFTNLLVAVNPNQDTTVYPRTWTQFTYTISGMTGPTAVKFALRYFVLNGGPGGTSSDLIGVDTFSVDRPLVATESFFASNFAVYPNPAVTVLNISNKNNTLINQVHITDINGRVVKNFDTKGVSNTQMNLGDLNNGVYFLRITSDNGVGTAKVIKE